jgi:DNA-binding SARP family transcriptional activator
VLEIRLLGRFELRRDGGLVQIPSRASQSLFAYLLLHPGVSHRREQLAGILAPDSPEESARGALRHALWRLRKSLEPGPLTGRDYFLVDELSIGLNPAASIKLDVDTLTAP